PHPPTVLVRTRRELEEAIRFPSYVKLPFSTAGRGVWLVRERAELETLAWPDGVAELLVQQPADGLLGVVQTVFRRGQLVAGHTYLARRQGVGGSAWARVGVRQPTVLEPVARLGRHLSWHGALMLDYVWNPATEQPAYIDANPRIGETFNATLSGVNLCEALLAVALDEAMGSSSEFREGVKTHALMMSLLALAEAGCRRGRLLEEVLRAWRRRGPYRGSQDELT